MIALPTSLGPCLIARAVIATHNHLGAHRHRKTDSFHAAHARSNTPMKSRLTLWLALLSALGLTGCVSTGGGSQMQTYQLTVTAPAMGTGTVTSSPPGINCPTTCSASFNQNTQITLTATAGSNY